MLKTLALMAVAVAALSTPAATQDPDGAAVVRSQLDRVSSEFGLTESSRAIGRLPDDGSHTATLQAPGGRIYFVGVCDGACSDLDLVVRDPSGQEVGRDMELDDVPSVALPEAVAGAYTVEVSMATCMEECEWGVGVFR